MSDISPRNRKPGRILSFLLLAVFLPCAGCPASARKAALAPADEDLLLSKADERLLTVVRAGRADKFAAIGVFGDDAFLNHAAALEQASIPVLGEFGKAAILLLSPGQVLPLLKDPSIRMLRWLGPQERLARLDPSFEIDLLARYAAGTEQRDANLLLRFVDVGGAGEERAVVTAGFRIVTRAGPTWVVAGPMSGLPTLLESDRIIYIEGESKTRTMPH